jgi:crotonobetainyl-CoA:carnitine CoA-transferase CaiB-like acyl-CoA transferase
VGLYDTGLLMTGWATMQHLLTGKEPQRHGNVSVDTCPSGVFSASDGDFYINCGNDRVWQRLAARCWNATTWRPTPTWPAAMAATRGATNCSRAGRGVREAAVRTLARAHARSRRALRQVRTVGQALRSAETKARGTVSWIPHPSAGPIPNIAPPWRFEARRWPTRWPRQRSASTRMRCCARCWDWTTRGLAELAAEGAFGGARRERAQPCEEAVS